jgi:hypothetical protein
MKYVNYKEILELYSKAIGMEVNFLKYSILFDGIKEAIKNIVY